MSIVLTVNMHPEEEHHLDEGGFRMKDRLRPKVAGFCGSHGIPDSDEFVSIAVGKQDAASSSYLHGYGDIQYRLKDTIVSELQVVCEGDFQTVAADGADKPKAQQASFANKFHGLTGLTPDKKRAQLEAIVHGSREIYIEARLFRKLTRADVGERVDNSLFGNLDKILNRPTG